MSELKAKDFIDQLSVDGKVYDYYSIKKAAEKIPGLDINLCPRSKRILLEGLLRYFDASYVSVQDIAQVCQGSSQGKSHQIAYHPTRVLMQDFTGVPSVVDLAALRDAMHDQGKDPTLINPTTPVDMVIDHSLVVDHAMKPSAFEQNLDAEMQRNQERYAFLKWGQDNFENFNVVPPGKGICHQVNVEYLAKVVWTKQINGRTVAYPDSLVGTDSHTTMVNGLGVIGWGVGGIEAESALLGQPIAMLVPQVVGVRICGKWPQMANATDLVLTITQRLRQHGVVGKFVEFFGPAIDQLSLPQRSTIANMSPEFGSTCAFFPIDQRTLEYLELTGRSHDQCRLVEAYAKAQGLWHEIDANDIAFSHVIDIDLSALEPCLAGPKRPQDRIALKDMPVASLTHIQSLNQNKDHDFGQHNRRHGDVVLAAITSCTNTSNPNVMVAAGLLAKAAVERGLEVKSWVKCSFAPGSMVVTRYLQANGLMPYLEALGFHLVGFGCTTCIGNSGALLDDVQKDLMTNQQIASAVLSGNRNFEGRIHPLVQANWLASPPLVIAYALVGRSTHDFMKDPIGEDQQGNAVYLKDLWPSHDQIMEAIAVINKQMFTTEYAKIYQGLPSWDKIDPIQADRYPWHADSTYVRRPNFFDDVSGNTRPKDINNAHILGLFGDGVTTDHISPAGVIAKDGPAAEYLLSQGVESKDFNAFGSRRGNHEVMVRGTFANIRIQNKMLVDRQGGYTIHVPSAQEMSIFDAAMQYKSEGIDLVVIAGHEYGTGSSRDWAAKGTLLLGVKVVLARSFERIHRCNLIGMGVLPATFVDPEQSWESLGITGHERIKIIGIEHMDKPNYVLKMQMQSLDGASQEVEIRSQIATDTELNSYLQGGILKAFLRAKMG